MKIWNGVDALPASAGPVVASIGNYDGVHRGHRAILDGVVADARRRDVRSLLITFEPHPLAVVAPDRRPQRLQTRRQKLATLESTGLDECLIVHFDSRIAELTGERFLLDVLQPALEFAAIHVGENFRFGKQRSGDVALLSRVGDENGFEVTAVPPVRFDGETVSSSAIRSAVLDGDVQRAARMLDRPFALTGEVVHGDGRGHDIGFPTANLDVENEILPRSGVYVTEVAVLAGRFPAMTNVGVRPTFHGRDVRVESHLLDFNADVYGERIEVRFLARIRDEMKFDDATGLSDQIARDRAAAEAYFHNLQLQSS